MTAEAAAEERPLGRFANDTATRPVDLGPRYCSCCPPSDEHDSALVRAELGDGEAKSVRMAGWGATGFRYYDSEAANNAAVARFTLSWTLHSGMRDEHGDPIIMPINERAAALLDEPTRNALLLAINEAYTARHGGPLPNASGAPSRGSSRGSASHTRTTRRRR